jgi:DNA-directed RNA polymerase subunit RPC12/RpoP
MGSRWSVSWNSRSPPEQRDDVYGKCARCGGQVFGVHGDLDERAVQRICRNCGAQHFIVDSGEYWDVMKPAIMICECDGDGDEEDFNVAVGYSL